MSPGAGDGQPTDNGGEGLLSLPELYPLSEMGDNGSWGRSGAPVMARGDNEDIGDTGDLLHASRSIALTRAPRCDISWVPKVMLTPGTEDINRLTSCAAAVYPDLYLSISNAGLA